MVVWSNERPGNDDIYARRLSGQRNQSGSWISIAAGTGFERRNPDVVFNQAREEFLVVWEAEPHGGSLSILGLRVSKFGEPIPPVIEISSGPASKNCQRPAVACASFSDKYLVVWENMVAGGILSKIEAQVISSSGVPQGNNFLMSGPPSIGFSTCPNVFVGQSGVKMDSRLRGNDIKTAGVTDNLINNLLLM